MADKLLPDLDLLNKADIDHTSDFLLIRDFSTGYDKKFNPSSSITTDLLKDGGVILDDTTTPGNVGLGNVPNEDATDPANWDYGLTGIDTNVVTGTPGTSGNFSQWNSDGDLIDSGNSPSSFAAASHTHPLSELEQSGATDGDAIIFNGTSGNWEVSGSTAPVDSVFGRTGDILAESGDYSFSQISGTISEGQLPSTALVDSDFATASEHETGSSTSKVANPAGVHAAFKQYGLGSEGAPRVPNNNVDDAVLPGFYAGREGQHPNASSGDNPFPSGGGAFTIIVNQSDAGSSTEYVTQIAINNTADAEIGMMKIRSIATGGSGWTAWTSCLLDVDLAANGGTVPEVDRNETITGRWKFKETSGLTRMFIENNVGERADTVYGQTDFIVGYDGNNAELDLRNGTDLNVKESGGATPLFSIKNGGSVVVRNPSGGAMGAGTLNAEALYDNSNRVYSNSNNPSFNDITGTIANSQLPAVPSITAIDFLNKESVDFDVDGRLYWDLSAGFYIKSSNAGHANPALLWSSANFTAGSGISVSYGTEDKPTLSLSGDSFNATGTYSGLRAQSTTKNDVGLGNLTNDLQVPASGGTFTGPVTIQDSGFGSLIVSGKGVFTEEELNGIRIQRSTQGAGVGIDFRGETTGGTTVFTDFYFQPDNDRLRTNNGLSVGGNFTKSSGSFDIPHPDPDKPDKRLRHCFVESPTAGDNLYRYSVYVSAGESTSIELPDYWWHLNENPQVWVSGDGHLGSASGYVDEDNLVVIAKDSGQYNILLIGTRKDPIAKKHWEEYGLEYDNSLLE